MKPTAILLCGLPYSGKSSLAAALQGDGYETICPQSINSERGLGLNGEDIPGSEWMQTHQIALDRMRDFISSGKNVVWDDTNYAAWIRDPIFEAAEQAGGEPVVVFVDAPLEVVRQRASDCKHGELPHDDFDRIVRDFEKPCSWLRIDGTLKPNRAVELLRSALRREAARNA